MTSVAAGSHLGRPRTGGQFPPPSHWGGGDAMRDAQADVPWSNGFGRNLRSTVKAFAKDVFINQERKTPPSPYEKSKSLGSEGSMVARLKLKGIDGMAPPGLEPMA
ncbi:UNVERIFIED_CONTAM: hypothetical protein Slati_4516800 [Sesamum latifolium]|uniref:Uncharacterized protein n=1 Tax=Sesamum latifolium TaxID=2727402 RepID=A0AAW2SVD9_9LAMI